MKKFLAIFMMSVWSLAVFAQGTAKAIGLTIDLPWANQFRYYDYEKNALVNKSGFIGFGAGVFCKWEKDRVAFNAGVACDAPTPFGAEYAKEGQRTDIYSTYMELFYSRKVYRKLFVAGGLNRVAYHFNYISYINGSPSYSKTDATMGITVGTGWCFNKFVSLAAYYRPALSPDMRRHTISLDLRGSILLFTAL